MTPTVTMDLSEVMMLKENVKMLEKAIVDKAVVIKTVERTCGGETLEERYLVLGEADAFGKLRDHYESELEQIKDYKAKWQRTVEILETELKTPWWKKIF